MTVFKILRWGMPLIALFFTIQCGRFDKQEHQDKAPEKSTEEKTALAPSSASIDSLVSSKLTRITTMRKDSFDLMELNLSTDGGVAIVYGDSSFPIHCIFAHFFGETYNAKSRFFYNYNDLVFVSEMTEQYNVPYYVDSARARELGSEPFDHSKSDAVMVECYFSDGKIFRATKNGAVLEKDSQEVSKLEDGFRRLSSELRSLPTL